MNISKKLFELNEPYAAGLLEFPERSDFFRYCNAQRRYFELAKLSSFDGGQLYPCGKGLTASNGDMALRQSFSYTFEFNSDKLRKKCPEAAQLLETEFSRVTGFGKTPHTIGGAGYTHSFINYSRIMREGIVGYRARVSALPDGDFRDGLLVLLDGIDCYKKRLVSALRLGGAEEKLIAALERADEPPRTLYEGLVAWNFAYYVDGCDDIGHLDAGLLHLYRGEDVTEIIAKIFHNVDDNDGWSGCLGPDCNELTLQCIRACHFIRRPNLQLRVTKDTPDEVWEAVYDSLSTSCGQPALYNEELFQRGLVREFPEIPESDRRWLAFGGCTETMIEGMSNVGSDDGGLHTALIFDKYMRSSLSECAGFEEFYDGLCNQIRKETAELLDIITEYRVSRAKYRPQPVRTLFVDDCIDRQLDFNAGGARYYWSVSNVSGMINVIDSLLCIRELVYEKGEYSAEEFLGALDSRDADFLKKARECPCFGVDNERADALAADFADKIYDAFNQRKCVPSGKYLPVSNQFTTYGDAGKAVRATPDGRADFEPLCDCLGAVHGKDTQGPTALLNSVAKLPLYRVFGTPVMNLRLKKESLRKTLRPLAEGFFASGGMQLQISCLSREEILDAIENPDKHRNLIVRIGGYSEYFNRLSPELKQSVLDRTEY